MSECQPIPCWSFVNSPGSQCVDECHSDHYRVKQYDSNCADTINWRRQSTMSSWISFSRVYLWWIIKHSSHDEHILNSHLESVVLRTGEDTVIQNSRYLWQVSVMSITEMMHEHIPDSVTGCRHRECREQLTPVVCDRSLHMSVIGEPLQTQGCCFIVKEKRCLTLNADNIRDEKSIFKVCHDIACPNTQ